MEPDNTNSNSLIPEEPAPQQTNPEPPESTTTNAYPATEPPKKAEESMKRIFVYDGKEYPDPEPKMSVDEVRAYYAVFLPELSNATTSETTRTVKAESKTKGPNGEEIVTPEVKERVITFTKRVGTKGKTARTHDGKVTNFGRTVASEKLAALRPKLSSTLSSPPVPSRIDEAEFKKIIDAFRENVEMGMACNLTFNGKLATLLPVGVESGVKCGMATLVK